MLSKQQRNTYEFIKQYITREGIAPSMAEIAVGIGISSKGVAHRYVHALAERGYIELLPNSHRNIRLTDKRVNPFTLPLLGKIAAGLPIEAIEDREVIEFGDLLFGSDRYALLIQGDSMIEEGICDGDIVICKQTEHARNGDIVVALIDNEGATLKRIHYHPEYVELIPANHTMEPQRYAEERVKIQGVYVGLCRFNSAMF